MNALSLPRRLRSVRGLYRPLLLGASAVVLFGTFWIASRYPQLLHKASMVGGPVSSMAFTSEVLTATAEDSLLFRIFAAAVNWLAGMRIGMTFGVLLGALLHTTLKYFPLKIGTNLYLNSIRGAMVGVPAGVCANCAVPTACGVTRGEGRIEVALGFLFSSPNFNPVVVAMTFTALPLSMALTKYAALALIIAVGVPTLVRRLERSGPLKPLVPDDFGAACDIVRVKPRDDEAFAAVARELGAEYAKNVWMLFKPTLVTMLIASVASAVLLTVVPWTELLSQVSVGRLAALSLLSTLMPVPIALDVMFAAHLRAQGVASSYVMMFAMTLGTYSILPTVYLWREVSKRLAVALLVFFAALGFVVGLAF